MKTLVLAAVLLSASTLAQKSEPRQKAACPVEGNVPTVTLCELVNDQAFYNNKTVRLKARYVVGGEVAAFEGDAQCPAPPGRVLSVEFDESYKVNTDREVLKTFSGAVKVRGERWWALRKADVTVVGRFHGAKEGVKIGDEVTAPGYGHLGAYRYQFVVRCIEQARRVNDKGR